MECPSRVSQHAFGGAWRFWLGVINQRTELIPFFIMPFLGSPASPRCNRMGGGASTRCGGGAAKRDGHQSPFRVLQLGDLPPSAVSCSVEEVRQSASAGCQVFVRSSAPSRNLPLIEFLHHGVYLGHRHQQRADGLGDEQHAGDGEVLVAELRSDGTVCAVPLAEFADGRPVYMDAAEGRRGNQSAAAAASRLCRQGSAGFPYNVMTSNCEHLSSFCARGTFRSGQVDACVRRLEAFLTQWHGDAQLARALDITAPVLAQDAEAAEESRAGWGGRGENAEALHSFGACAGGLEQGVAARSPGQWTERGVDALMFVVDSCVQSVKGTCL